MGASEEPRLEGKPTRWECGVMDVEPKEPLLNFDSEMVTVPEAIERQQQAMAELQGRQSEVNDLEARIRSDQGQIHTHYMHMAICRATLSITGSVTGGTAGPDSCEQPSMSTPKRGW